MNYLEELKKNALLKEVDRRLEVLERLVQYMTTVQNQLRERATKEN